MLVLSPKTCPLLWDRPISFLWWGAGEVAADRWPHPSAGSARTDEPLPVPGDDPSPTLPPQSCEFPLCFAFASSPCPRSCSWLGECGGSVNWNLCGFPASSSGIYFFLEEGTQVCDPDAGTQSTFLLFFASLAQAILLKKRQTESSRK